MQYVSGKKRADDHNQANQPPAPAEKCASFAFRHEVRHERTPGGSGKRSKRDVQGAQTYEGIHPHKLRQKGDQCDRQQQKGMDEDRPYDHLLSAAKPFRKVGDLELS
jgi:hypothetical protein